MKLLRELYPNGSKAKPNFYWHTQGYEKWKPYDLFIHDCVDGFSRKMLWLKV